MLWFVIILNKGHWRVTEMGSRSTILVTGELNLDDCVDRFGIELTGVTWRTESCIPLLSECIFTVDGDLDEQDKWFNLSVASNQYQLFVLIYFYFELLKRHLTQNSSWPGYRLEWCRTTRLKILENLKPAFLYSRALYISEDIEAFWYDSLCSVDEIPSKRSALTLEEFLNLKKLETFKN